ncbi:hypothetical protein BC940DRAFT_320519 [Gongronella butleri]|nr:hypothetical protein BC940DRAFT_320519 [Gongronella butleri]
MQRNNASIGYTDSNLSCLCFTCNIAIGTFTITDAISSTEAIFRIDCLSFDRIVPGCEGGAYVPDNIQVVNVYINMAKSSQSQEKFEEWLARMKRQGANKLKANLMSGIRRAQARNRPS